MLYKIKRYIIDRIKRLPEFYFQIERLDIIIWNDKKGDVLEILLFDHLVGYF